MATYEVKGADGAVYHIDGPDGADPSAVVQQVIGQHAPDPAATAPQKSAPSPTLQLGLLPHHALDTGIPIGEGGSNFLAGAGMGVANLARGIGQNLGLVSRADVAKSRGEYAPTMATGAGKVGDVLGQTAAMLPLALIPGANTMAGAAAIGAGSGFLQPSTSTGETLKNTALGGAAGPAALGLGRGLGALFQGGKAALEPLFQGGQQRIAARTMQSFAGGPQEAQAAASAIQSAPSALPGVQPTTAELANNAGLAQLERTMRNNPEGLTALTARNQSNRAAMTGALDQIAGTPQQMTSATAARSAASNPLYAAATTAAAPTDAVLTSLLERPSMQAAYTRAEKLAAENGTTLTGINGQTLQYLKMGLNDLHSEAESRGMGAHELRALSSTLSDLNGWISKNIPSLRAADTAFAKGSIPINQMQVGGALRDKLVPALGDFGNNTRLTAQNFASGVRNGDQLAASKTGLPNATLQSVLSPNQMLTVNRVGEQLARRANADELGRAVGSNTGQNLASQNVLRQFLGPLGLPQSMGERAAQNTLAQSVLRPLQFTARLGEQRVMEQLQRAALDPNYARHLLTTQPNSRAAQMLWQRQGLLNPIAQGGLLGSPSSNPQQQ